MLFAETLYEAGYRKVPDGSVIIPAEERDEEMKEYNEERAEFEKAIERLKIQLEQSNAGIVNCSGCKLFEINAVKEFAEKLKEKFNGHGILFYDKTEDCHYYHSLAKEIDELLKEYEK